MKGEQDWEENLIELFQSCPNRCRRFAAPNFAPETDRRSQSCGWTIRHDVIGGKEIREAMSLEREGPARFKVHSVDYLLQIWYYYCGVVFKAFYRSKLIDWLVSTGG